MVWLRHSIAQMPHIIEILGELKDSIAIEKLRIRLTENHTLLQLLAKSLWDAIDDEPASFVGKGGKIFRTGYSIELDDLTQLEQNFDGLIAELEKRERETSGISTLKIGYTRVFGYYFEVSKAKTGQVPAHFVRKQTLTNGERYTTPELKELENKAVTATERRTILERELFESMRTKILENVDALQQTASLFAEVDVLRNFAALAIQHGWCKPIITDEATIALENSVHPILKSLQTSEEVFIANNVLVGHSSHPLVTELFPSQDESQRAKILLITGPNMAGKSTIMRQVALTQILCQMGSFVPGTRAVIGVADRIFTRIGSADYALRNQSTFMVEMLECAHMMRLATPQSLLLMDELGRGTSTYDGLSLAWAILEDIHDRVLSRTLFSTHYHELLAVCQTHKHIMPMQMEVIERERTENLGAGHKEILFSRRFIPGAAGKSFGLHVAELAGIQPSVVGRASEILFNLTSAPHSKPIDVPENAPVAAPTSPQVPPTTKRFRKRADQIPEGCSIFDFAPYIVEN
jgi:DNA mismatch repair protein MutS